MFSWFKKRAGKKAVAFVDYEYWFYTYLNQYHMSTDPMEWRTELEKEYDLQDIMVFGDFSNSKLSADLPKLRTVTNTIVETGNNDGRRKKDMTDFIMLDYIYQTVAHDKNIGTFIILTGDGHFQSVVKYLVQQLHKTVVVYGIKDSFSQQLQAVASKVVTIPVEDQLMKHFFKLIIEDLAYAQTKPKIIPTISSTAAAVARKYNVSEAGVKATIIKMLEDGYLYQRMERVDFNRSVKVIAPEWERLIKEGYWKP